MRKTVTIKGIIHKSAHSDDFTFFVCDMSKHGYLVVAPHEFQYEVPEEFDPIAAEVGALNKELDRITENHVSEVRRIKGRIAELLCIENRAGV